MKKTATTEKHDVLVGIQDDYVYEKHRINFM